MIHVDIAAENVGTAEATAALREELTRLISGLDARFMQAGTALATSVEAIDRIASALTAVGTTLNDESADDSVKTLLAVATRLSDLPRQCEARGKNFKAAQQSTVKLRESVGDVLDTLRVLRIYGINVKIAASGADEFVAFIDTISGQIGRGEDNVKQFNRRLDRLRDGVARIENMDRLLLVECIKIVPEVPKRLADEAAELRAHQGNVAVVASRAGQLALSIQAKVGAALGALQVGDIARQRLEHVLGGIQLLHAHQPGWAAEGAAADWTTGYVLRLFATQLSEAADEFGAQAGLLIEALQGIAPDAKRLLSLREDSAAADGDVVLSRIERSIAEIELVTSQLGHADRETNAIVAMIADTVDELTERLQEIRDVQFDVQQMAINIGLRCRRMEEIGKPVTVIAKEIRNRSSKLDACTVGIANEMKMLGMVATLTRAGNDETLDFGKALARSLAAIRSSAAYARDAMSSAGADATRVVETLDRTTNELACELGLSGTIHAIGNRLEALIPPAGDEPPEGARAMLDLLLPQIGKLYTMASEREVHQRFLLPGMTPIHSEEAASASGDDDLFDDGLF